MKTVNKPWGREEWLVLNDKYCLKRMYVEAHCKLSLQYHEQKKETMFLEEGVCILILNDKTIPMERGKAYTIHPRDVHRLIAHKRSVILEVSTPEVDDIVRVEDEYNRHFIHTSSKKPKNKR